MCTSTSFLNALPDYTNFSFAWHGLLSHFLVYLQICIWSNNRRGFRFWWWSVSLSPNLWRFCYATFYYENRYCWQVSDCFSSAACNICLYVQWTFYLLLTNLWSKESRTRLNWKFEMWVFLERGKVLIQLGETQQQMQPFLLYILMPRLEANLYGFRGKEAFFKLPNITPFLLSFSLEINESKW